MDANLCIAQDPEADALISRDPFALLTGMLLDQQIRLEVAFLGPRKILDRMVESGLQRVDTSQQFPMERAFAGPAKIRDRFGTMDPAAIAAAEPEAFADLCATPPAIHRYGRSMAGRVQALAQVVVDDYDGSAERIWTEATSGADLFARVRALPGFGDQKAKIFTALVAKQLGIKPPGWTKVVGDYGKVGYRSVADVIDPESLQKVREFKKAAKAAAKQG